MPRLCLMPGCSIIMCYRLAAEKYDHAEAAPLALAELTVRCLSWAYEHVLHTQFRCGACGPQLTPRASSCEIRETAGPVAPVRAAFVRFSDLAPDFPVRRGPSCADVRLSHHWRERQPTRPAGRARESKHPLRRFPMSREFQIQPLADLPGRVDPESMALAWRPGRVLSRVRIDDRLRLLKMEACAGSLPAC
jgi:hypothetical protein